MGNIFRKELIQASSDGVLDKAEWQALKKTAEAVKANEPKSADAHLANQVMPFLDSVQVQTRIGYTLNGPDKTQLQFNFTPHYSESEPVPGRTPREQLNYISQRDTLPETNDEGNRCAAASMLNAFLLLGGSFSDAASRLGLPSQQREMTFGNVHRAQEALYDFASGGSSAGLSVELQQTHLNGQLLSVELQGDIVKAAQKMGLKATALHGKTPDTFHQREEAVKNLFYRNPSAVILVGVNLNQQTGALSTPDGQMPENHFVTVFRDQGKYYLADTGASDNGKGNAVRELSTDQLKTFVYQTPGSVLGISRW